MMRNQFRNISSSKNENGIALTFMIELQQMKIVCLDKNHGMEFVVCTLSRWMDQHMELLLMLYIQYLTTLGKDGGSCINSPSTSENMDYMLPLTHSQTFGCYIVFMGNYPLYVSYLSFYLIMTFLLLPFPHQDGMYFLMDFC